MHFKEEKKLKKIIDYSALGYLYIAQDGVSRNFTRGRLV